jgi:uncharacterized linocin/CFP29 family protein
MVNDLSSIGWTETQFNKVLATVTEEAQRARVAAQMLPIAGPELPSTFAIPQFTLDGTNPNPYPYPPLGAPPANAQALARLTVDSEPTLFVTTIAVNVALHAREAADPDLQAALVMFRRAANYIARVEDAVVFAGRPAPDVPPLFGTAGFNNVFKVTGHGSVAGIFAPRPGAADRRQYLRNLIPPGGGRRRGTALVNAIVAAISNLESAGQLGPYACVLSQDLFQVACRPTRSMVLPRDRILPFLQGPLLRSSAILDSWGAVIALSGSPIELVVASDIDVKFLQITEEPRLVFRVSERVALRIKDERAIVVLTHSDDPVAPPGPPPVVKPPPAGARLNRVPGNPPPAGNGGQGDIYASLTLEQRQELVKNKLQEELDGPAYVPHFTTGAAGPPPGQPVLNLRKQVPNALLYWFDIQVQKKIAGAFRSSADVDISDLEAKYNLRR